MSLPKFDIGDCFLLSNVVYTVDAVAQNTSLISCSFFSHGNQVSTFFTYPMLISEYSKGNLTAWVLEERRPQNAHKHEWKLYKGLNVVEKYCDCGENKNADWKELS